MSTKAVVHCFYANRLYGQFNALEWKSFRKECGPEIYNGAYVRIDTDRPGLRPLEIHEWCRPDGTPVLPEDVPVELKALCLLMGLSF